MSPGYSLADFRIEFFEMNIPLSCIFNKENIFPDHLLYGGRIAYHDGG